MDISAVEAVLSAGVTALSSCVVYLFFELRKESKKCEQERERCEEDRRKLWQHIYRLEAVAKMPSPVAPEALTAIRPKIPGRPDSDHDAKALN